MITYTLLIKNLFLDIVLEVLYFPLWWYSRGLKKAAYFCWKRINGGWRALALSILLASFFKPMYGERGWDAYVLSLFVRFFKIIWRFFLIFLWVGFWLFAFVLWLVLPLFIVWGLMYA